MATQRSSATKMHRVVTNDSTDVAQLTTVNQGKMTDFYDIEEEKFRDCGFDGFVSVAKNKSTGAVRAVKTLKDLARAQQEITILKMMDHPNIIKLHESFEEDQSIYLVTELCAGGELYYRITEAGSFSDAQAATLMDQIVRATFYMHENHVVHRGLKPECCGFMTKGDIATTPLKIMDFHSACTCTPGQVLEDNVGTAYYVAPDVLRGNYNHMCDMWSIGVILYVFMYGYPPFFGETDADVLARVRRGTFCFRADGGKVSEDAKSLIRNLLKCNPRDRFSAEQVLNNEWLKKRAT